MDLKPKTLIIGLDGATFTLLKPWADQGLLPNIARIIDTGCHGVLKSTTPPYTPPAWASFYTGVNPGKHGIFGFSCLNGETGKRVLSNSTAIGSKKIWQLLNDHGVTTGLINLPLTYPPEPVDGYMVTGMMTPDKADNFTFPADIAAQLRQDSEPYTIDVLALHTDAEDTRLVKKLSQALKSRLKACFKLMEERPCDFMTVVFVTPDRLQHVYWKYIDENNPHYDDPQAREWRPEIIDCYRELDSAIGELLNAVGDDCTLFVISDHGFSDLKGEFLLNDWLLQNGYMNVKSTKKMLLKGTCSIPGVRGLKHQLVKIFGFRKVADVLSKGLEQIIDWQSSVAYTREQGIFINLKGREEHGSVEPGEEYENVRKEIAERLLHYTHPRTGEKIVEKVVFKEELYQGDNFIVAPDLIPVMKDYSYFISKGVMRNQGLADYTDTSMGNHHPDGIMMARGPNIRRGAEIDGASIIDMAPTVLHSMGLPVPGNMDGRVLTELFEKEFIEANPVIKDETGDEGGQEAQKDVYTQDEAGEIEEQLRGMGYI